MLYYLLLIAIFADIGVAGMPTRRNVQAGPDVATSDRISSMVIKGIVIGTRMSYSTLLSSTLRYSTPFLVLFIGALLLLHLYRRCLFPTQAPAATPMHSTGATASAPSALTPLPIAFDAAKASNYIAYPPSTAGTTTSGDTSMYATPRFPGGAHGMKTKFTAPVAGPRAPSIRKTFIV